MKERFQVIRACQVGSSSDDINLQLHINRVFLFASVLICCNFCVLKLQSFTCYIIGIFVVKNVRKIEESKNHYRNKELFVPAYLIILTIDLCTDLATSVLVQSRLQVQPPIYLLLPPVNYWMKKKCSW